MSKLPNEIIENGIHYRLIGDYYFPDVTDPDEIDTFGKWGDLHLKYLREYQPEVYRELFYSDRLVSYLRTFNEQAAEMRQSMIASMQRQEGVTEELKERDPVEWARKMNWIAAAEVGQSPTSESKCLHLPSVPSACHRQVMGETADEIVIAEMVSC